MTYVDNMTGYGTTDDESPMFSERYTEGGIFDVASAHDSGQPPAPAPVAPAPAPPLVNGNGAASTNGAAPLTNGAAALLTNGAANGAANGVTHVQMSWMHVALAAAAIGGGWWLYRRAARPALAPTA